LFVQTDWSSFYPQASEVLDYIRGLVEKYNLARYIKLQHTLVHARYNEPSGKWHLTIRRPLTNTTNRNKAIPQFEEIEDIADVFLTATGALNRWKWPDIKGLADFQGRIVHTARWDITEGNGGWEEGVRHWGDKSIGVIGSV
jgi:cation diffusion facilitator CzcD-associated flavoprotein CzcO